MGKTKFDIRTEATRPLYASVGVVDRAAEIVRGSVADAQKRLAEVRASVRGIELEPAALQVRARELLEENEVSYDQLVTRGEVLVARIRNQESTKTAGREAKVTSAKAKTTRTQAKKAGSTASRTAKNAATRPTSSAKATGTAARKSAAAGTKAASQAAKKVGD